MAGGRPRKIIDWAKVDEQLIYWATAKGICSKLGITDKTLEAACKRDHGISFSEYSEQKREIGKNYVRGKQFQVAMSGNVSMLIWLGKQWLGQTDKIEQKIEADVQTNVQLTPEQIVEVLQKLKKTNGV